MTTPSPIGSGGATSSGSDHATRWQGRADPGAAGGIGRKHALRFATEGAKVVAVDLDREAAGAVAAEITGTGGKATAVGADVSATECEAMVAAAEAEFGRLDVVFNNWGSCTRPTMTPYRPMRRYGISPWTSTPRGYSWVASMRSGFAASRGRLDNQHGIVRRGDGRQLPGRLHGLEGRGAFNDGNWPLSMPVRGSA